MGEKPVISMCLARFVKGIRDQNLLRGAINIVATITASDRSRSDFFTTHCHPDIELDQGGRVHHPTG
jgi:hypothetical protein